MQINSKVSNDMQFKYFCPFCLEQTVWESKDGVTGDSIEKVGHNTAFCTSCYIEGTNYANDCPNLIQMKSKDPNLPNAPQPCPSQNAFLFSIEKCRPQLQGSQYENVVFEDPNGQTNQNHFQCFGCCLEQMMVSYRKTTNAAGQTVQQQIIPPFRYVFDILDGEVDDGYCHMCLKFTQWQSYAKRQCLVDPKSGQVVVDDGAGDLDDIGLDYEILKKCQSPTCCSYKTIKPNVKCCGCEMLTNEIYMSSQEDGKCHACFEQAAVNKMLKEQFERQQLEKVKQSEEKNKIRAKSYKYYCPFCADIKQWNPAPDDIDSDDEIIQFSECEGCKSHGSVKPDECRKCQDRQHVYRDKDYNCARCAKQVGPRDVINVSVNSCYFCKDKIQTFYEFGIGLLQCQNCMHFRSVMGPNNTESEQYCMCCKTVQPALWSKNNIQKCRKCWDVHQNEAKQYIETQNNNFKYGLDEINYEAQQTEKIKEEKGKLFRFECNFCGIEDSVWRDLGDGTSRCLGCKTLGSNSYEETCAYCNQQDYIFTLNKVTKCFSCWNKDDDSEVPAECK